MRPDLYLDVEGARLRYRDEGHGSPVVLLHGWTLDLDMWEPQVEGLRNRFRLVRFDRRGFGLSTGIPDVAADAMDVRALCRRLGIERAAFVGMSQGARILERLIVESPELISCLVFDGAPDMRPGGVLTRGDIPVAEFSDVVRLKGLAAFRKSWAQHPLARLVTADPRMHELVQRMLDRYPANDLLRPGPSPVPDVAAFRPEHVQAPALVLNGTLDLESRRRAGDLLAQLIPSCERALIPNAGHIVNLDNPEAYNAILIRFMDHVTRRGPTVAVS